MQFKTIFRKRSNKVYIKKKKNHTISFIKLYARANLAMHNDIRYLRTDMYSTLQTHSLYENPKSANNSDH